MIDVIDNGIGLPKVARQRLLEPYVTTRQKGTGLGLAIVGRVLEDHGGRIELKDASDFRAGQRGAWMRLRFAVTGQAKKPGATRAEETQAARLLKPIRWQRRPMMRRRRSKKPSKKTTTMKQKSKPQQAADKTGATHGQ